MSTSHYFRKLPPHRALKTVFTSFRKLQHWRNHDLRSHYLFSVLKIVSAFNRWVSTPSLLLTPAYCVSSPGFILPSNSSLQGVFSRQNFLFMDMHASQGTYPYASLRKCHWGWTAFLQGGKSCTLPRTIFQWGSQLGWKLLFTPSKTLNRPKLISPLP